MSQTFPSTQGTGAEKAKARRTQKLIKRGIQLRLSAVFAGLSVVCLLTQWLLFTSMLSSEAHRMPVGGEYLLDLIPQLLYRTLFFSVLIALPLTLLAGIQATFRITGPIYRFETYLKEVIRGTQLGPCKIRKGDALGELCELINQATEPVRRREVGTDEPALPAARAGGDTAAGCVESTRTPPRPLAEVGSSSSSDRPRARAKRALPSSSSSTRRAS